MVSGNGNGHSHWYADETREPRDPAALAEPYLPADLVRPLLNTDCSHVTQFLELVSLPMFKLVQQQLHDPERRVDRQFLYTLGAMTESLSELQHHFRIAMQQLETARSVDDPEYGDTLYEGAIDNVYETQRAMMELACEAALAVYDLECAAQHYQDEADRVADEQDDEDD